MTLERIEALLRAREEVLEKLRCVAPVELDELQRLDRALSAVGRSIALKPKPKVIAEMPPLEAARFLLGSGGAPMLKTELISVLFRAGVSAPGGGKRPAPWKLALSLNYHLKHGNLKASGEEVGLPEWYDESGARL